MNFTMLNPRPQPPPLRDRRWSTWKKRLKMRRVSRGDKPMPLSLTENRTLPFSAPALRVICFSSPEYL